MNHPQHVKDVLWGIIHEMSQNPGLFAQNPDTDFTRKHKLDFENLMHFLVSMEGGTTGHELLKYFDFDVCVLTNSAFYQQRKKLLLEAFQYLLYHFNSCFPSELYKEKYILVACDGCEFTIFRNPNDPDSFHPPGKNTSRGFNMIHTTSLYDILNKRYLDCVISPGRVKNEYRAICELNDRFSYEKKAHFHCRQRVCFVQLFCPCTGKGSFLSGQGKRQFCKESS